jgi:hypothetical protein
MVDAKALANRIKKALVVSVMEHHKTPGPVWAMPLDDDEVVLIVQALSAFTPAQPHASEKTGDGQ